MNAFIALQMAERYSLSHAPLDFQDILYTTGWALVFLTLTVLALAGDYCNQRAKV